MHKSSLCGKISILFLPRDYALSCFSSTIGVSSALGLDILIPLIRSRNSFASFIFSASAEILVIHRSNRALFSASSFSARCSSIVNEIPFVNISSCRIYCYPPHTEIGVPVFVDSSRGGSRHGGQP